MTARVLLSCLVLGLLQISNAIAGGTLTHLSGKVSLQRASATPAPARSGMAVDEGDTLITGDNGYVRVELTDGGEMVLRPGSQLTIDRYAFVEAKPESDSFVFRMIKGGLRTVTGLVGKRGNQDAYQAKTTTATIGIRGTQYDMRVCDGNCGALANGTYVAVRFGAIATTNPLGSLNVQAGQVAYVPQQAPPVLLPRDPGIGFTPPATIPKLDEKKKEENKAKETSSEQTGGGGKTAETQSSTSGEKSGSSSKTESTSNSSGNGVECTVE